MQRLTSPNRALSFAFAPTLARWTACLTGSALILAGCTGADAEPKPADTPSAAAARPAADWTIASPPGVARPPFTFAPDDEKLLEEVQRAAFWFLWRACDPATGMVVDRSSVKMASTAGVGFQLAALPAAAERGWITRDQARERAELIMKTLDSVPNNRKAGLFFHYLDGHTGTPINTDVVSTIDSALLFAGILVSSQYFQGNVKEIGDRLVEQADWSFFLNQNPRPKEPYLKGFLTLGWKPNDFKNPTGEGTLRPYCWADAGDEQRLVYTLAVAAPLTEHGVDPSIYYRMRRQIGEYPGVEPLSWFPWSGAIFTNFFAHCFINYSAMGPDNPAAQGVERRPRIDWWENSRRAAALHRVKCIENPRHFPTLGENAWGLSACDSAKGYSVPGVFPHRIPMAGEIIDVDYSNFAAKDDFGDGTVAPYAAGCTIMFDPAHAIAALRHYRTLTRKDGTPAVWRDPGEKGELGEYGFRDSFNLGTGWTAPDYVAIDEGPLVLAIENARTGLIWRLFHEHPAVKNAMKKLGLSPVSGPIGGQ